MIMSHKGGCYMKALLLLSVAFMLGTTVAQAETFTIAGKSQSVTQVGAPGPMGKPVVAGSVKIETDITWASGSKEHSTGDCVGWSAPPASGFTSQGICNSASADGKSSLVFSCLSTNDKNTENDCWGRLTYLDGKNKDKTATVSWHGKQNADGKGGTAVGAGNMN